MIGHIPFVSSSPSSTTGPSLFRDKLVCQNQQEREWLASARVISPWNSARTKLKQQDGSAMARIAEARNMPVEVISVCTRLDAFFQYYGGSTNDRQLSCTASFVLSTWIEFCFLDFSRRSRMQVEKIRFGYVFSDYIIINASIFIKFSLKRVIKIKLNTLTNINFIILHNFTQ